MAYFNSIRFLIVAFIFVAAISPKNLYAVDFKDLIFEDAKSSFVLEDNQEIHTSHSNRVKLKVNKTPKKKIIKKKKKPSIGFFKYDKSSKNFINISQTFYWPNKNKNRLFLPLKKPKITDRKKLDLFKSLPLSRCELFKEDETIFIVYDNVSQSSEKYIQMSLRSKEDKEIIRLLRSNDRRYFVGYINTTSICKKLYDGKLYAIEGSSIEATLMDLKSKKIRSLDSEVNLKAVAKISNHQIESNSIKKEKILANAWLSLKASKSIVEMGEVIEYYITIENRSLVDIDDANLSLKLSNGLILKHIYKDDKEIAKKSKISLKIAKKSSIDLKIIAQVDIGARDRVVMSALLLYEKKKEYAKASSKIVDKLGSKGVLIGELRLVDSNSSDLSNIKIFLENGYYTLTDRFGKFHFDKLNLGSHVVSIDPSSLNGRFEALECKENARSMGSKISQFFTLSSARIKSVSFCLKAKKDILNLKAKMTYKLADKVPSSMPQFNQNSFKNIELKEGFLWPPKGHVPSMPTVKVALLHKSSQKVVLYLNGKKVDMLNFDGSQKSKDGKWVIDKYRGVDIVSGDNILQMKIDGSKNGIKRLVHLSTAPVSAKLIKKYSYLYADGKNAPVLAIRLTDMAGYPLRAGMSGEYSVQKPYISEDRFDLLDLNPLQNRPSQSKYIVENDGICYIRLHPTSRSGEVTVEFPFLNKDESIKAWLSSKKREWFIVGFAKGSIGYQKIKEAMKKSDKKELITNNSISLFAKGSIGAKTLLTIAYNSSKKLHSLENELDLRGEFTVYGDSSSTKNEAPSSKKLYIKIERERFYALFGDFETSMDDHELIRYNRVTNGIKSEFKGKIFSYKAFVSQSKNSFFKDELRGDGTSGLYHLSQKDIVEGSLKISIITRDRFEYEKVIQKKELSLNIDYNVDYQNGTIYFKEPILNSDNRGNPIYIIASYERESSEKRRLTYGGRVGLRGFKDRVEVGISGVVSKKSKNSAILGADFKAKIANNILLNAEIGKTVNSDDENKSDANAYLIELKQHNSHMQNRLYYRYQEKDYGLNQIDNIYNSKEKYALESTLRAWQHYTLRSILYKDKELQTGITHSVAQSKLEYKNRTFIASLGAKYIHSNSEADITQLSSYLSKRFWKNRFKISTAYEKSLNQRSDYLADRSFLELSYFINQQIELFLNTEVQKGSTFKKKINKVGLKGSFWRGGTISSTLAEKKSPDSSNLFTDLGVNHIWQIDINSSALFSYESKKSFHTGQSEDDFNAYSISYNKKYSKWIWSAKAEYKDAKKDDKINIDLGVYTKINDKLGLAMGFKEFRTIGDENKNRQDIANISLGYRKRRDLTILNKIKIKNYKDNYTNKQNILGEFLLSKQINPKHQVNLSYAVKYIKQKSDELNYDSLIDSFGLEYIYDLNKRVELGTNLGILHSYNSGNFDELVGLYFGYNIFKNIYIGLGYNIKAYYEDSINKDVENSNGAYLKFRVKLDNSSLEDLLEHF